MDVLLKITSIAIIESQVAFTITYSFNGEKGTRDFNFPASQFKNKTFAQIKDVLLSAFKQIIKEHYDSVSEISGDAWIKQADFLNKTFTVTV